MAPVSVMTYCSRLVGGLTLHVVLVMLKFAKISKISSFLVLFKLLVGGPNRQSPSGKTNMLRPKLIVAVDSALWTGLLFLQSAAEGTPDSWLHQ